MRQENNSTLDVSVSNVNEWNIKFNEEQILFLQQWADMKEMDNGEVVCTVNFQFTKTTDPQVFRVKRRPNE